MLVCGCVVCLRRAAWRLTRELFFVSLSAFDILLLCRAAFVGEGALALPFFGPLDCGATFLSVSIPTSHKHICVVDLKLAENMAELREG